MCQRFSRPSRRCGVGGYTSAVSSVIEQSPWPSHRWTAFRRALRDWYVREHRPLAWRPAPGQRGEPYAVLVSEAMLQQTQVATVEPYFDRFMKRFATVESLAAADEADVLHVWQGLGYYRRARHLHRAAKMIVDEHGGRMPSTADALIHLPGVGRYTAGAIASIAFGERTPILDGNVARVLARLFGIDASIDEPATKAALWSLAERVVAGRLAAGDLNQAMMELGARRCTPRGPKCPRCPVRGFCAAAQAGRAEQLPVRSGRRAPKAVTHRVIAVQRGRRWLFERRGDVGLWAGMWQMPTFEGGAQEPGAGRNAAEPRRFAAESFVAERFGVDLGEARAVGRFEHVTTHRRIAFVVHRAMVHGGRLRSGAGVWRTLDAADDLPMSNAQRRVVQMVAASAQVGCSIA